METDVWDEIQKLNPDLEGRFGGFDVSDEPIMFLDISDPKIVFAEYEEQALDRLINRALEQTGYAFDAGSMYYYTVYGSGENRELVCMQLDGDLEFLSRYQNVKELCEKMRKVYNYSN